MYQDLISLPPTPIHPTHPRGAQLRTNTASRFVRLARLARQAPRASRSSKVLSQPTSRRKMRPWVKTQIVPPMNIRFNPTTKIGSKMNGAPILNFLQGGSTATKFCQLNCGEANNFRQSELVLKFAEPNTILQKDLSFR